MSDRRLDVDSIDMLRQALERLDAHFSALPATTTGGAPAAAPVDPDRLTAVLAEVASRFEGEFPFFHPLYAGQMLKPPHPVARLACALAMHINPNNHALDGGRASSRMEKEAVAEIAAMFGWSTFLGHLTGGGTMANLEALWVAGRLKPGATVLASSQAHYTHSRISAVLSLPFESIPCDARGRMDMRALELRLKAGGVGTVVATIGTTATGSVDPLADLLALRERHGFRLHADAAYGGYFTLVDNLRADTRAAFDQIGQADSIVIDPHKHGLQPYGCGCVLFRDPAVGTHYKHDSPYTYFSSGDLHLGEISLECSRPGAAAVGLWATQRLMPLIRGGEFARGLAQGRAAALDLHARLKADPRFIPAFDPELDIVVWLVGGATLADSSEKARRLFSAAARHDLHLALAELPTAFFDLPAAMPRDQERVTCLRSVLMKPEHAAWMEEIWGRLSAAAGPPG